MSKSITRRTACASWARRIFEAFSIDCETRSVPANGRANPTLGWRKAATSCANRLKARPAKWSVWGNTCLANRQGRAAAVPDPEPRERQGGLHAEDRRRDGILGRRAALRQLSDRCVRQQNAASAEGTDEGALCSCRDGAGGSSVIQRTQTTGDRLRRSPPIILNLT